MQRYYDEGHSCRECMERFGFSAAAWRKAVERGALNAPARSQPGVRRAFRGNPIYDWAAVQRYYDEGHTYQECMAKFGFCAASWTKAVARGALKARARRRALHDVLASSTRVTIKQYLLKAGILQNVCSECGISEWRGKPLSIQIDHRNGIKDDHRIENLRMLCPNCHSQTDTFAARNRKLKSQKQSGII